MTGADQYAVGYYPRDVTRDGKKNAFAQIEVQLKRRYDLIRIPELKS